MAEVAIAITPTRNVQLFAGLPASGTLERSFLPRGCVSFQNVTSTIAAKGAGNTQTITTTCTLPPNYAYSLQYLVSTININTELAAADDFERYAAITLNDGRQATPNVRFQAKAETSGVTSANAGSIVTWSPINLYKSVFWNQDGVSPVLTLVITDSDGTNARAAASISNQVQFLQFDIDQATDVRVNAPQPVRLQ